MTKLESLQVVSDILSYDSWEDTFMKVPSLKKGTH